MCMDRLDDVRKRHRIGLKILNVTDDPNVFESQIMDSKYTMNEWKDAGNPKLLMGVHASTPSPQGKVTYKAGIHYYRNIPHFNLRQIKKHPVRLACVKFKLKGIIETGMENGVEAGVARMACPIGLVNGSVSAEDFKTYNLKKLLKLTDGQFYIDLFNNRTSDVPTVAQLKAVCERAAKSCDNYSKYIMFIDMFNRTHDVFKFFTKIHLALFTGPNKDKIYQGYYYKITSLDPEMFSAHRNILERSKVLNIVPIDGPVA